MAAIARSRWLAYALCCAFVAACGGNDDNNNTGAAPTFTSTVADQNLTAGTPSSALPFTIADADTAASSLIVTATSSNTTAVPNNNITLGGSGANRTITINPAAAGDSTITISVNDGSHTTTDTFVVHSTSGGTAKTFDSPADGAQLAAALANLFNQVGGGGTTPKAMRAVHPKFTTDCPGGGTLDTTDDSNTAFVGDGTIVFNNCTESDNNDNTIVIDGQMVTKCTDANQDQSNCDVYDFDNTLGQTSDPLSIAVTGSGVDVQAQFYQLLVSTTDDNNQSTYSLSLDGRMAVADNGDSNCGSGDFTVDTVTPMTVDQSTSAITAGEINLTASDDSTANVVFHDDGSETVTVNGVAQDYTAQQLASYCSGT